MTDEITMARIGLLDALEALESHLDALVIIGAQAVYMHTGAMENALAEFTTDGDVAVDPDLLNSRPLVEDAMSRAGFVPDPRPSAIGSWISPRGVAVDLMVPDAVAGAGRRGVRVPPHDSKSMRRARGIEATLIDNSKMVIRALDPAVDPRAFDVSVAGPAALLVAKLHKIHDRIATPSRQDNKDAHDIYRLLRAVETDVLSAALSALLGEALSEEVAHEALDHLSELFAWGTDARGSVMARYCRAVPGRCGVRAVMPRTPASSTQLRRSNKSFHPSQSAPEPAGFRRGMSESSSGHMRRCEQLPATPGRTWPDRRLGPECAVSCAGHGKQMRTARMAERRSQAVV